MTPVEAKQRKKPTKITIHITIRFRTATVFFLPRSCRLGCYRLGLEQQKSRRIDRETETDGFLSYISTRCRPWMFLQQRKIDASAAGFFLTSINKDWAGFFSEHDGDMDLLYFGFVVFGP